MEEVVIVSCTRSPHGSFNGSLSSLHPSELCGHVIKSCISQSGLDSSSIESVFVGNVVSAGIGQNPAKQCAIAGGIKSSVPCTLINKVCCSSMKAMTLGAQEIMCGQSSVVLIAGVESMSKCPSLVPRLKAGETLNTETKPVDSMVKDGLWDSFNDKHMGFLVDAIAEKEGFTREEQDNYALRSFSRAQSAWDAKAFNVTPIPTPNGLLEFDENIKKLIPAKVPTLRPSFSPKGTITAANASSLADGAVAAIICSSKYAAEHGLKPIAKIISFADAGVDPSEFPLATIHSTQKALNKANLSVQDIDLWEVNEAFSAVPLLFSKSFGISQDNINVLGGSVAIGHPLGCTGLRIICTLIDALKLQNKPRGLATLCNGGGGATSVILEMI